MFANIEDPSVPLTAANIDSYLGTTRSSNAGVSVDEFSALGVPAFLKGVNLISHSVAKTPLHIYRRTGEGRERDRKHPADRLLNGKFNKYQSALIGKSTLQKDCVVSGNGYGWIVRNQLGEPTEIYRLDPFQTAPEFLDDGQLIYKTNVNNEELILLPDNVLHIQGVGNGLVGYPVLQFLADSIGLGIAQQRYSATYFGNGAVPPLALTLQGVIKSEEARVQLRQSWNNIHGGGPTQQHRLAILEEGATLNPISVDPQTSQLIESRQFSLIDFANMLGVPASWLGAAVNTSYSALEAEDRAFLRDGLDYWLCNWEAEVNSKLLTEKQQELGSHYPQFKREALIRMAIKDERSVLLSEYHGGLRSWEESREVLDATTNQEGFYLRPSNLLVETFEEPEEPEPAPPQMPPQMPPPEEPPVEEPEPEVPEETQQSDDRLQSLTTKTIDRLFKRLSKATQGKGPEWLEEDMEAHWPIFFESLEPVASEEKIKKVWADLRQELSSVSSADWPKVWEHKDPERTAIELC
jgi:HK97 family phage portal protein